MSIPILLKFRLFVVILALTQIGPAVLRVAAYDLSGDFSTTSNPSGYWSYGAMTNLGGTFSLYAHSQTSFSANGVQEDYWLLNPMAQPFIMHNGTTNTVVEYDGQGVYPPGTILIYASTDAGNPYVFGVARFTVPPGGAGTYLLDATAHTQLTGPLSGDTDFHVLANGVQLFGQFIPPSSGTNYTTTLDLAVDGTIDFAVGQGSGGPGSLSGAIITANLTRVPQLKISVSKVKVTQNLVIGLNYILEASTNLVDWTATGPTFTATNNIRVSEFDVDLTGQYFRLLKVP
jgi:hypothetical protein